MDETELQVDFIGARVISSGGTATLKADAVSMRVISSEPMGPQPEPPPTELPRPVICVIV